MTRRDILNDVHFRDQHFTCLSTVQQSSLLISGLYCQIPPGTQMNLDENILRSKIEEVMFWETGTGLQECLLYSGGLNAVL